MANYDFKEALEMAEYLMFRIFLLATFLIAILKILYKELEIGALIKKLVKWNRRRNAVSSTSSEVSRSEVLPP